MPRSLNATGEPLVLLHGRLFGVLNALLGGGGGVERGRKSPYKEDDTTMLLQVARLSSTCQRGNRIPGDVTEEISLDTQTLFFLFFLYIVVPLWSITYLAEW